jgi:hypothetical protein
MRAEEKTARVRQAAEGGGDDVDEEEAEAEDGIRQDQEAEMKN